MPGGAQHPTRGIIFSSKPHDVQAPNEARFRLLNPCPFPVEVLSLDFDARYREDEDVLRALEDARFNEQVRAGNPSGLRRRCFPRTVR